MGEVPDRAFYSAPVIRHVEVAQGLRSIGVAAWQSCHQLQIVKLRPSVVCLKDGAFQGCYALTQIITPGCVQFGRRAFAECCSLSMVGVGNDAINALAPGAQILPYAFESCLASIAMEFEMSSDANTRALPEGSFCGSGIESLRLPPDFNFMGPMARENCKRLAQVDLFCTDIRAIWGSTFSYCVTLVDVWLPPKLRRIGKEAFLCCASLREVKIPPELHYLANRAFCGCEQLTQVVKLDDTATWRGLYAENNAFLMCDKFTRPSWIKLLPPRDVDSDAFDEELRKGLR